MTIEQYEKELMVNKHVTEVLGRLKEGKTPEQYLAMLKEIYDTVKSIGIIKD
jgi:hypothetical protein